MRSAHALQGCLILFVGFVVASCGTTVQSACNDYAAAWCNRHYSCYTDGALAHLQAQYGPTAADCAIAYAGPGPTNLNCAVAQSICPPNTSYDTGAAENCVATYNDTTVTTCDEINNPEFQQPQNCAESIICH